MDGGNISELFNCQAALVQLTSYKNEFCTIQEIHMLPNGKRKMLCRLSKRWLACLKDSNPGNAENKISSESKRLREEGNKVFNSKQDNKEILAANLYTKAIFAAGNDREALALSYANRAMSLQAFGYYQQAYDDCECALQFGYPLHLRHKIITRQAYCALNLQDFEKLEMHIDSLKQITLNDVFANYLEELKAELLNLKMKSQTKLNDETIETEEKKQTLNRQTQRIVSTPTSKGRYMIASTDITQNTLIFMERASSFVPVGDKLICQQCAATQIIPIPCARCNGQVVYCSLKCRQKHADLHNYECVAYQLHLFKHIGIAHLALRTVLEGLPQIIPLLKAKTNAQQLWSTLFELDESVEYARSLHMISHLNKMSNMDILWFALMAEMLLVYLIKYTIYFDQFVNTAANLEDWHHVVAALILRGIGQLICNGHTSYSIMPRLDLFNRDNDHGFTLLQTNLWTRPFHVRLGLLHKFSCFENVTAMNLPYLSICNHACAPSFQTKFDGRFVSTYATKNILAGEEITNCYTLNFRQTKRAVRCDYLLNTYHFQCQCEKCMQKDSDAEYELFHRYRCEQNKCRQIYVPQLQNLNWWSSENDDDFIYDEDAYIQCSICKTIQQYKWLHRFNELINQSQTKQMRLALYKHFCILDEWLIDYNELKLSLAFKIIDTCFKEIDAGSSLDSSEFMELANIIKFYLQGVSIQSGTNSINFVTKFTYLWDLIALGHYKCSRKEIQSQLDALEHISMEYKNVFLNYLNEFMLTALL